MKQSDGKKQKKTPAGEPAGDVVFLRKPANPIRPWTSIGFTTTKSFSPSTWTNSTGDQTSAAPIR